MCLEIVQEVILAGTCLVRVARSSEGPWEVAWDDLRTASSAEQYHLPVSKHTRHLQHETGCGGVVLLCGHQVGAHYECGSRCMWSDLVVACRCVSQVCIHTLYSYEISEHSFGRVLWLLGRMLPRKRLHLEHIIFPLLLCMLLFATASGF